MKLVRTLSLFAVAFAAVCMSTQSASAQDPYCSGRIPLEQLLQLAVRVQPNPQRLPIFRFTRQSTTAFQFLEPTATVLTLTLERSALPKSRWRKRQ